MNCCMRARSAARRQRGEEQHSIFEREIKTRTGALSVYAERAGAITSRNSNQPTRTMRRSGSDKRASRADRVAGSRGRC